MSETFKIVLTSALTIIGGVVVYLVSQVLSKFVIDPIHEQKKTIGQVADALIYHRNVYSSGGIVAREKLDAAHDDLRLLATELRSKTHLIPMYNFFSRYGVVLDLDNVVSASTELIRLSNMVYQKDTDWRDGFAPVDCAERIADALNIKIKID